MAQAVAIIGQQSAHSIAQAAIGWMDSICRRALTLATAAYPKNSKACMLAAAAAALACIGYQNSGHRPVAIEQSRNETIAVRQNVQTESRPAEMEASDEEEDEADAAAPSYAHRVQTVRIFNSAPAQNTAA